MSAALLLPAFVAALSLSMHLRTIAPLVDSVSGPPPPPQFCPFALSFPRFLQRISRGHMRRNTSCGPCPALLFFSLHGCSTQLRCRRAGTEMDLEQEVDFKSRPVARFSRLLPVCRSLPCRHPSASRVSVPTALTRSLAQEREAKEEQKRFEEDVGTLAEELLQAMADRDRVRAAAALALGSTDSSLRAAVKSALEAFVKNEKQAAQTRIQSEDALLGALHDGHARPFVPLFLFICISLHHCPL